MIESFTFTSLPGPSSMSEPLSVGTSVLKPVLQANTTYWLAAFPGASDSSGGWNLTSPLQTGTFASSEDGGSTWVIDRFGRTEISAFEVDGVALPEPTTLTLCALGGILLSGYGARRRIGLPCPVHRVIEREPRQA
jgi:hypothetical protein